MPAATTNVVLTWHVNATRTLVDMTVGTPLDLVEPNDADRIRLHDFICPNRQFKEPHVMIRHNGERKKVPAASVDGCDDAARKMIAAALRTKDHGDGRVCKECDPRRKRHAPPT